MSQPAVSETAVAEALARVLVAPSPEALWRLRGDLLAAGRPADDPLWPFLDRFHNFLSELSAKATAREYSHFASLLDIGAVGGVAVQNLLDAHETGHIWRKLLTGGLSEGLMVMAARQYVKAWEEEMTAVYRDAGWSLYTDLWQLSVRTQPALDAAERRRLVDGLLAPLNAADAPGTLKAVLIGRLYQLLLLAHLAGQ